MSLQLGIVYTLQELIRFRNKDQYFVKGHDMDGTFKESNMFDEGMEK